MTASIQDSIFISPSFLTLPIVKLYTIKQTLTDTSFHFSQYQIGMITQIHNHLRILVLYYYYKFLYMNIVTDGL